MENTIQLNEKILSVTKAMRSDYPELSKYIAEMPVKISYKAGAEISIKNLQDYYDSLNELMERYAISHTKTSKQRSLESKPII